MTFRKNLALASTVLAKIKAEVTSSNDIIPGIELPTIIEEEIPEYSKKFGVERMHDLLKQQSFLAQVRSLVHREKSTSRFQPGNPESIVSPITTLSVAVAMMGVGECSETANLAAVLLCKSDCSSWVNVIALQGVKPSGDLFIHALVVIGDCTPLTNSIESFQLLGDDCVLLDPLVGVVGEAKAIQTLSKEDRYLQTFKLTAIFEKLAIHPTTHREQINAVSQNAAKLRDQWQQEIGSIYKRSPKKEAKEEKQHSSQFAAMQFGQSYPNALREQLKRITGESMDWRFYPKEKHAFLVSDQVTLDAVREYFTGKGFKLQPLKKVSNSDNYYLAMPPAIDLEQLRGIDAMPLVPSKGLCFGASS